VVVGGLVGPLIGLAMPGAAGRATEPHLVPANSVPLGQATALADVTAEELGGAAPPERRLIPPPVPFGDLPDVSDSEPEDRSS
jgi:hypothetical protein